MIKRLSFASRAPAVSARLFPDAWLEVTAHRVVVEPADLQPARLTVGTRPAELVDRIDRDPGHDVVTIEWFTDVDRLAAHDDWLAAHGGRARSARSDALVRGPFPVMVAEEVVVRGTDWLARRWQQGSTELKHMALARRAPGLFPEEFSRRWRDHAGRVGGLGSATPPTPIPDDLRGSAYVQNHPRLDLPARADDGVDRAYDAVNEVYFDDLDGLVRRIRWFEDNGVGAQPDELFGASWFLAVRETVLFDRSPHPPSKSV